MNQTSILLHQGHMWQDTPSGFALAHTWLVAAHLKEPPLAAAQLWSPPSPPTWGPQAAAHVQVVELTGVPTCECVV